VTGFSKAGDLAAAGRWDACLLRRSRSR